MNPPPPAAALTRFRRRPILGPVLAIPQRISLTAQTAVAIEQGISQGIWRQSLPGIRRLCEILEVSRPTVQGAIHLLARDGLCEIRPNRRTRLLAKTGTPHGRSSHVLGLITNSTFWEVSPVVWESLNESRVHLAASGISTEILVCREQSTRAQRRKLEDFLEHKRVGCCLLLSVSGALQKWFQERRFPCLLLGSCRPAVQLPSIDVDYRAVCRHAAMAALRKGHRKIGLIVPDAGRPGEMACIRGFEEAVADFALEGACGQVVEYDERARQSLTARLAALYHSAQPPTALLVVWSRHVLNVIMFLVNRGLKVPQDVSLISIDHDYSFETASPMITHYLPEREFYSRRITRLVRQMFKRGSLPQKAEYIFPRFVAGATVRQLAPRVHAAPFASAAGPTSRGV